MLSKTTKYHIVILYWISNYPNNNTNVVFSKTIEMAPGNNKKIMKYISTLDCNNELFLAHPHITLNKLSAKP